MIDEVWWDVEFWDGWFFQPDAQDHACAEEKQAHWGDAGQKLKDRITPQVNFFLKWASMVLAGTGKEGKTKEVVKDREGKMVGIYVCMYGYMYVCMYASDDDIEERYLAAEV